MTYRDDREALQRRVEQLEEQVVEASRAGEEHGREDAEKRAAELSQQVEMLRRQLASVGTELSQLRGGGALAGVGVASAWRGTPELPMPADHDTTVLRRLVGLFLFCEIALAIVVFGVGFPRVIFWWSFLWLWPPCGAAVGIVENITCDRRLRRIYAQGERTLGSVVANKVTSHGKDQVSVNVTLLVEWAGHPPYEAEGKVRVPAWGLSVVQPGERMWVYVDPLEPWVVLPDLRHPVERAVGEKEQPR
jgi:hypothetical protein